MHVKCKQFLTPSLAQIYRKTYTIQPRMCITLFLLILHTDSFHSHALRVVFPSHTGDICLHHSGKPSISRFPPCAIGRCNLPEQISAVTCNAPATPIHTHTHFPVSLFLFTYSYLLLLLTCWGKVYLSINLYFWSRAVAVLSIFSYAQ